MDLDQALKEFAAGNKITHYTFGPHEYIHLHEGFACDEQNKPLTDEKLARMNPIGGYFMWDIQRRKRSIAMANLHIEDVMSKLLQEEILAQMSYDQLKQVDAEQEKIFEAVKRFLLNDDTLSKEQKDKIRDAKYKPKRS